MRAPPAGRFTVGPDGGSIQTMHPNPVFRQEACESALALARERGFGVFTVAGPEDMLAAHLPFVLDERRVLAHLVRVNPLARRLGRGPGTTRQSI